jgi:hypothetical protein
MLKNGLYSRTGSLATFQKWFRGQGIKEPLGANCRSSGNSRWLNEETPFGTFVFSQFAWQCHLREIQPWNESDWSAFQRDASSMTTSLCFECPATNRPKLLK